MEKTTVQAIFCYVVHILTNWRDVIDLVKYTVLILIVHANDLLKYLAFKVIPQYCIAHPYCARFLRH